MLAPCFCHGYLLYLLQQTKGSRNARNGYRPKTVIGDHGEVTLDIPRDRENAEIMELADDLEADDLQGYYLSTPRPEIILPSTRGARGEGGVTHVGVIPETA